MTYRYFTSASPPYFDSTKELLVDGFQALLNSEFANSTTYQDIQEEAVFASGSLTSVSVRVNRAINSLTGEKLGDDFKQILFSNITHVTGLGYKYFFDNNWWLVTFSETIKNLAASCVVRRCNNTLRWVNINGKYFEEPCIIDYNLDRPRDSIGAENPVIPQGFIDVYCQLNENTKYIKGNQRFLFGDPVNRIAYKVFGDGVKSYLNQETNDDASGQLLTLIMGGHMINVDNDDIINGIADANQIEYSLSVSPSSISGSPTTQFEIYPVLSFNGEIVSKPLSFSTSSSAVAIVSASGIVTMSGSGTCTISCYMTNNACVVDTTLVTVSSSSIENYEIRIDPIPSIILEGSSQIYVCGLYQNGNLTSGSFVFDLLSNLVPSTYFTFTTVSGSAFSVINIKKYLSEPLSVNLTSGSYTKNVEIRLKGGW